MRERGITVVSPMWGERDVTDRMVFSVIHQFISSRNPFNIHLVLVDDYIEGRKENDESPYDYYISEDFKEFYNTERISITLIKNSVHKYQGESREIGFIAGKYNYFILVDCDDMLSPNCCDRYLGIIDTVKQNSAKDNIVRPIAFINGLLYSFDSFGNESNIPGHSIWVQGRCYNRDFIKKHNIHFPTGLNSKQGEDYPFIRKLDYAMNHDNSYQVVQIDYDKNKDCQATAFWFPNENSLSRKDPHYTQHLAGWTLGSSLDIISYFEEFNAKNGFEDQEDEYMKHEVLNMNIYAFYNILDFIHEVSATDYIPLKEDWESIRDNARKLREHLLKYWDELVNSDVEDCLYGVHHNSDVHFIECWFGTFWDWMAEENKILTMTYDEMTDYAKSLKFDEAKHEENSKQVIAWKKRHGVN